MIRYIIFVILLFPISITAQDLFELDIKTGYAVSFGAESVSEIEWSPQHSHIVGIGVRYSKQLHERSYLSVGANVSRMNVVVGKGETLYEPIPKPLWWVITREYDYLSVPVEYRSRLLGSNQKSWWLSGGASVAWVFDNDIKEVKRQLIHDWETSSERIQSDHPSQFNLLYHLGTEYHFAASERWSHAVGLEGRLSNFGVHDDAPGLFEHGEWSVNLTYRLGLAFRE